MNTPRASATGARRPASGITIDTGRLIWLRIEKGWERPDLARETGLSLSMIRKIESGERRPRADTLKKLCTALGCQPSALRTG